MSLIKKSNELVIPTTVKMMIYGPSRYGKEYSSIECSEAFVIRL